MSNAAVTREQRRWWSRWRAATESTTGTAEGSFTVTGTVAVSRDQHIDRLRTMLDNAEQLACFERKEIEAERKKLDVLDAAGLDDPFERRLLDSSEEDAENLEAEAAALRFAIEKLA